MTTRIPSNELVSDGINQEDIEDHQTAFILDEDHTELTNQMEALAMKELGVNLTTENIPDASLSNTIQEEEQDIQTLRIAFVGNVDSGKSSLIGTLIKGELDDGRGSSRKAIFRHKHEIETGRTSSVATAYIGFNTNGDQLLSKRAGKTMPWSELAKLSHKRIQLIDLAGHEKYLKTTVFGLTGMQPDIVVVVVGANMGVKRMTKEHFAIAVALEIPLIIALTKIDIAPKSVAKETLQTIRSILRKYRKMAMLVKTEEQAITAAKAIPSNRVTPILPMSNVTGDGLMNLRKLFFEVSPTALFNASVASNKILSANQTEHTGSISEALVEMPIDETYQVPGAGFLIAGTLMAGTICLNDVLMLGPDYHGAFHKVTVRSMESMYVPLQKLQAGQTAAIAIRSLNKRQPISRAMFRKGMILLSPEVDISEYVSQVFEARVIILHHQTTVTVGYQPMINCRTIRQTAAIIGIGGAKESQSTSEKVIRTGDRALVAFRFLHSPEFLKKGMRFVFRDGQAKGIGKIVRILPTDTTAETVVLIPRNRSNQAT